MPEPTIDTYSKAECDQKHKALAEILELKQQYTTETLARIEANIGLQAGDLKILANQMIRICALMDGDGGEVTDGWGDQLQPKRKRRPQSPPPLTAEWFKQYWVMIGLVGSLLGFNVTGMVRNTSSDEVKEIVQETARDTIRVALEEVLNAREESAAPTSDRRGHEKQGDRKID